MSGLVEPSPKHKLDRTRNQRLISRATQRIQGWLRPSNGEQLEREMTLRLEERNRERERIARELHDTLFQGFLGAEMHLHAAMDQVPADSPGKPALNRAVNLMHRVIDEGRDALHGLRLAGIVCVPLEQALSKLREDFTAEGQARFRIFVNGESRILTPEVQAEVYLIGREAVVNALRHSAATTIEAEVEYSPRSVRVIVRDNGCGIDEQQVKSGRSGHWGLLGMRERANNIGAQLRIWSRPGAGTEVEISVPCQLAAQACA
jgi:signal transduction histidine kinase